VAHRDGTCLVRWDELAPDRAGPWPAGGTVLFLWPHLRGDLRRPAWARGDDDAEDEYTPWWNREDSKVSAALLLPFYADLVAFLTERAGPVRLGLLGRFRALRDHLERLDADQPLGALAGTILGGATTPAELAALVEGAEERARTACTVVFGAPKAAVLHARRDERGLWLWLAPGVRDAFDRFVDGTGAGAAFLRESLDWAMTGAGPPAPRPPETLRDR
jgi:hypothetical protein